MKTWTYLSKEINVYPSFKKIPRLERDIVFTEKLDGTNGIVAVLPKENVEDETAYYGLDETFMLGENTELAIYAGSRSRWLKPGGSSDNFEFASWVAYHSQELIEALGVGVHYGEWWGSGINRGYGLSHRYFTLFNPAGYGLPPADVQVNNGLLLGVVPVLHTGKYTDIISVACDLDENGSKAVPGYEHPEGVVCFHSGSRQLYKLILNEGSKNGSRG